MRAAGNTAIMGKKIDDQERAEEAAFHRKDSVRPGKREDSWEREGGGVGQSLRPRQGESVRIC